jgi:hypothetical protein
VDASLFLDCPTATKINDIFYSVHIGFLGGFMWRHQKESQISNSNSKMVVPVFYAPLIENFILIELHGTYDSFN